MNSIINSPLFGVILSIACFEIGLLIYKKTNMPLFNPLLICVILIASILIKFNINLDSFNLGGNLISFFLGPATVVLAVPLYNQLELIKKYVIPIILGITVGTFAAIFSVVYLCKLFNIDKQLALSLVPKSITTPIGMEVSKVIGGIPAVTVSAIVITGIMGAVVAPIVCKLFKIEDKIAIGIAIGTSTHAVGTTKAMEMGETEGAMSGLAIGIAGLATSILAPILIKILS
ncbi:LrgB family protein [uncultured Clostridium sp.]|uniref:LrgB family protein n=1 Tax=uncultured Clostridium sp. TaxID=59620 RepID=UPI0028E2D0C1|nr:LrgB family protein [uncultured Clostridium sp.]